MKIKAKESIQIQKARQKIEQQIQDTEKKASPEALNTMSLIIKEQLHRHQPERINLKNRQVTTFDENQHSAKTQNKFILKLVRQIKHEQSESGLSGRIKTIS